MTEQPCPQNEQLASFVRCELSEEVAAIVLDHLDNCPHCEETVANLEHTMKAVLPGAAGTMIDVPYSDESACQRAIQSLVSEFATPSSVADPGTKPDSIPGNGARAEFQTLRDFRIIEKVGQGGMGSVYKAVHQRMQRTVALKVLPSAMIGDQSAVARFSREMSVLGQLNHPNIVQAFDAGDHDGQHYLAMEFIEGQDLGSVLRRHGRLSVANACLVISQVATALQYAHEKGFVHRDIKPSNLMLAETVGAHGNPHAIVKLLDLGLARVFEQRTSADDSQSPELTSAGQIMGTLDYMAPEQGSDSHQVDIRTDIYSLGATLYKLLTGDAPFAEHAGKAPMKRLMAIATHEPPAIRSKRADVPEKLAAIVHRMLAKKPENRFATPAEVVEALEPFCTGANLAAMLIPQGATRTLEARPQVTMPARQSASGRGTNRRWKTALAGFGGFCFLAAILLITTRHGTVEVTSPDGKLPDDVKVVVSHGGDEVELLQADNQWSAKIVNGEYQVQLRGGEDRFEIKDSKLTVSRMGRIAVTVDLLKPVPDSEKPVATTTPPGEKPRTSPEDPGSPARQPVETVRVAFDETKVAPTPAVMIPDHDRPFVVINKEGESVGEYKFITEVLPILKGDEILEVRGNGPFKLPQIVREKQSLHIRAGKGYRPQFVPDFKLSETQFNNWIVLQDVTLLIEGCDFTGSVANGFALFGGTGPHWSFHSCRLIQPVSNNAFILGFTGQRLTVRDSLLTCHSAYFTTSFGPKVQAEFHNNIVFYSSTFLGCQPGHGSSFTLKSNLIYNTGLLSLNEQQGDDPVDIVAEDNLFVTPYSSLCATASTIPVRKLLSWKGSGNRVIQSQPGPLFASPDTKVAADPLPKTVEEWNAFWGNAGDLQQSDDITFEWDFLASKDWNAGAGRFRDEVVAARSKFPALPQLGPEMELVGAGPAYEQASKSKIDSPNAERPVALEGGPFVIIREGESVAGFVSLAAALAESKTGDVIEVRSDGTFRSVSVQTPKDQRLTLRVGLGYSPVFTQLWLGDTGDWTLEGLRLRPETGGNDFLRGHARRIANCTTEAGIGNGYVLVTPPAGLKDPVEIVNCYFSQGMSFYGSKLRVENSVLSQVVFNGEATFDAVRSCFWNHPTPMRGNAYSCIGQQAEGEVQIHAADCLFDANTIMNTGKAKWAGERNLYRIRGALWGVFSTPGRQTSLGRSLSEWRDSWKSDADSDSDESATLRPELWRQQ